MKIASPIFEALAGMVDLLGTKKTRFLVAIPRRRCRKYVSRLVQERTRLSCR
jgi:hypothetical protein